MKREFQGDLILLAIALGSLIGSSSGWLWLYIPMLLATLAFCIKSLVWLNNLKRDAARTMITVHLKDGTQRQVDLKDLGAFCTAHSDVIEYEHSSLPAEGEKLF